jgi:hypothetical protein
MSEERKLLPAFAVSLMPAKQEVFLDAYAKHGCITAAAKVAGIDRKTHYNWLGPKDNPTSYAIRFNEARDTFADRIRYEIKRRALEGVKKAVYYKGEKIGTEEEHSDRLLEMLAKAHCPEYRDKAEVTHSGEITHKGQVGITGGVLRVEFVRSPFEDGSTPKITDTRTP